MDLITGPPPPAAVAAMGAVPGVRIVPAVLNTQVGPAGHLGPEEAGAILVLQGTFVDHDRFAEFWDRVVELMAQLASAPGFIRRVNFADGPHYTLIAWWRTVGEAHAFFASPAHQAAMRATFEHRWNYTHFAGLWEAVSRRERLFFCQSCDGIVPSTESVCPGCGSTFFDPLGGNDVRRVAGVS